MDKLRQLLDDKMKDNKYNDCYDIIVNKMLWPQREYARRLIIRAVEIVLNKYKDNEKIKDLAYEINKKLVSVEEVMTINKDTCVLFSEKTLEILQNDFKESYEDAMKTAQWIHHMLRCTWGRDILTMHNALTPLIFLLKEQGKGEDVKYLKWRIETYYEVYRESFKE